MNFNRPLAAVRLGVKSLQLHKLRSSLTILGVVFGVCSVIIMLAIAAAIAAPVAYLINTTWLKFLAFHVSFGAGTILAGVSIVFIFGILTILTQTLKAANSNPVDVLKYE